MAVRRTLHLPITLAVVMIVMLVILTVGWVFLAILGAMANSRLAGLNWTLLSIGTTFIALLLVGVIMYLGLSIKQINFNRRQSNFIDSVTHEFKSPIASMKLCLQTLSRHHLDREQQESFFRFMLEDLDRLDLLITQVLEAGRMDRRETPGETEDVDLHQLLQDCAENVCLRFRVPSETIQLDLQPCRLSARRVDLEIVFRNLMDNAIKYAGSDPQVEVTSSVDAKGNVVTRVRDNGDGIPHRSRRRIFRRFERLGMELERQKTGTGLGLYIVESLVKRLGGRVRVVDPESGSGSVFEVTLPRGKRVEERPADQSRSPRKGEADVA